MSDKERFKLEQSRFKQRFPDLPQEQFQYLLKKEKPDLYKTAVREGWLKITPEPAAPAKPKAENDGGQKPPSNNNKPTRNSGASPEEPKGNSVGQKQTTGSSPKPSNGGVNSTTDEINKLYAEREKTINPNDILGKGAKATESAAEATSKESLLSKFGQLGQKSAQIGQKIISSPIVNNPVTRFGGRVMGKLAAPLAVGALGYDALLTANNWNAAGSSPTSRFFDAIGNHEQARIRREADAPYGSYTSSSLKEPTDAERAQMVDRYNVGQPQANMSEEDALKMQLYGTTNVGENTVPLDYPNISSYPRNPEIENYTGSTGGGDLPPIQNIPTSGGGETNNNNNNVGLAPVPQQTQSMPQGMTGGAAPYTIADYEADKEAIMRGENANPYTQGVQQANEAANRFLAGEGYVSQQDIYNKLQGTMNQRPEYIDPRYQGDIIPAQGYYVSPAEARWASSLDAATKAYNSAFGTNREAGNLQNLYKNNELMYEIQMANKAGVPYAEYKQAMLDKYTNEVKRQTDEANNLLKFQAQQTTDATQRRELIAAMQKNFLEAHQKMNEARMRTDTDIQQALLTGYSNIGVANINARANRDVQNMRNIGEIQKNRETLHSEETRNMNDNLTKLQIQQMLLSDPNKYINSISNLMEAQSYLTPDQMVAMLSSLSPQGRARIFGRDLSVNELGELFNAIRSNDNGFSLQAFFNRLRGTGNNAE